MKYELRELDAWGNKEDGYTYNTSYHIGYMVTSAKNERRAILNHLRKHHGIIFKRASIKTIYDGDIYEICCRKTEQPIIAAIPIWGEE